MPKFTIKLLVQGLIALAMISVIFNLAFNSNSADSEKSIISRLLENEDENELRLYSIQTEGCTILGTNTNPIEPKPNANGLKMPDCGYEETLSTLNDQNQMLQLTSQFTYSKCCLQTIERIRDLQYKLSDCDKIPGSEYVNVSDKEMFVTHCGHHMNFEANFKITAEVQRKLNKWKSTPGDQVPMSVIFVGIDSISRSMLHRYMPKSVDFIKNTMGFVDFKGHHSAGPATIYNVYQFLMGITKTEGEATCHPDWTTPFDPCPFIWKNYSENDYITMFNEDGHQTFNFGTQSGFNKKPTDYYTHSLFSAMEDLRLNITYKVLKLSETNENLETYAYCTSRESVPQFVKRYTQRFLMRFAKVPTFSYTWFENPFHDFTSQVLPNYDDHFLDFFRFLSSNPSILDKTAIVFASDHGAIFHYPEGSPLERFLEQNAPFLFIRLPKKLLLNYPEENILEALNLNSERLTTQLDLHRTLIHFLRLSTGKKSFQNEIFQPNLLTTSSLLLPVNTNRTCKDIKVENCVCKIIKQNDRVNDKSLLALVETFVVNELNQFVKGANYSHLCHIWESAHQYSSTYLQKAQGYDDILFNFKVNPKSATFQVKVRIFKTETKKFERIGEFLRTSEYANQSWCVRSITDLDKQMKGACVCK